MTEKIIISKVEFNKMCSLVTEIHGISSVIDCYIHKYNDIDDIDTVFPILKFLRKTTDDLYYFLTCIEDNSNDSI